MAIGLGLDSDMEKKKKIEEFFYTVDVNPDGCIAKKELSKAVDEFLETEKGNKEIEKQPFFDV